MTLIHIESEDQLINRIKETNQYYIFQSTRLPRKIDREERAWDLLKIYRGRYDEESLSRILYIVDYEEGVGWWFGKMISSNKGRVLEATIEKLNAWIEYVCFSKESAKNIVDNALGHMKISNAHRGLVTLLLYLSDPSKYSIWIDTTHKGLISIRRIGESGKGWGNKYVAFNNKSLDLANDYNLNYREIDWFLWYLKHNVTYDGSVYKMNAV